MSSVNAVSSKSVSVGLACSLPFVELNKLYHAMENAFPGGGNKIVQFASAYGSEGADVIAFEIAQAAALAGKRVLFIDTTNVQHATAKELSAAVKLPLNTLFSSQTPVSEAIVFAERTTLFYATLNSNGNDAFALNDIAKFQELLHSLRDTYELVVIASVTIVANNVGLYLAKAVDGVILVIEAQNSRAPVVMEAKKMLEESGSNIIGAVLNKRRLYIPQYLYRWLYHNGRRQK